MTTIVMTKYVVKCLLGTWLLMRSFLILINTGGTITATVQGRNLGP